MEYFCSTWFAFFSNWWCLVLEIEPKTMVFYYVICITRTVYYCNVAQSAHLFFFNVIHRGLNHEIVLQMHKKAIEFFKIKFYVNVNWNYFVQSVYNYFWYQYMILSWFQNGYRFLKCKAVQTHVRYWRINPNICQI